MVHNFMVSTKVAAMKRIKDDTAARGSSAFPRFMRDNMKAWEREGLVKVDWHTCEATLTDKGKSLAKKAIAA